MSNFEKYYKREKIVQGNDFTGNILEEAKRKKVKVIDKDDIMSILKVKPGRLVDDIFAFIDERNYTRDEAIDFLNNFKKKTDETERKASFHASWIIPRKIMKSCRPGYPYENQDREALDEWLNNVRAEMGVLPKAIIVFLDHEELDSFYDFPLLDAYKQAGIAVYHLPTKDPIYDKGSNGIAFNKNALYKLGDMVLNAMGKRQTPILIHCSAGIDRSGEAERYLKDMFKDGTPSKALYPEHTYDVYSGLRNWTSYKVPSRKPTIVTPKIGALDEPTDDELDKTIGFTRKGK